MTKKRKKASCTISHCVCPFAPMAASAVKSSIRLESGEYAKFKAKSKLSSFSFHTVLSLTSRRLNDSVFRPSCEASWPCALSYMSPKDCRNVMDNLLHFLEGGEGIVGVSNPSLILLRSRSTTIASDAT